MIDSALRYPPDALIEADLCIVGAGPAGLAIAHEFLNGARRVLLVESGDAEPREADQDLNRGLAVDSRFEGLTRGRARAFGGTTWLWAGQCVPLGPEVFEPRPWIAGSRWPITGADVAPYLDRASSFLGLPGSGDPGGDGRWSTAKLPALPLDEHLLTRQVSLFPASLQVGAAQLECVRRSRSVTALLHATVTRLLVATPADVVEEAEVSTADGVRRRVRARAFVLCCGAIENARLLLLSGGLDRRFGALGRYFQDHLLARAAALIPADRRLLHDCFAFDRRRGRRRLPRLSLSPDRQRAAEVLACDAYIGWEPPASGPALRHLADRAQPLGTRIKAVADVAADAPEFLRAAIRYGRGLSSAPRHGAMWIDLRCEQAPDESSRLRLSDRPDRLGLPQVELDWRYGEREHRTMREMVEALAGEFRRLKLGEVVPSPWLGDQDAWSAHVSEAFHHMGTTRMSESAGAGVVDAAGKVHGVANLYIAGSSVFPAAGAGNPTLPLVALALRLADHLKRELAR